MKPEDQQALAESLFAEIRALTFDGVGVSRASYGEGESAAAQFLTDFARQQGLAVHTDRAANVLFSLPDVAPDCPAIWCASHLDSVPQGGNFDGLAGIIAGLLCLLAQRDAAAKTATKPATPLRVVAFRGEESAWFGKAYAGSGALFGKLSAADLTLQDPRTGESLGQRMHALGADVAAIGQQQPLLDPRQVLAYLELHIEQGPVMLAKNIPLAVVSGIRGSVRHNRIQCVGEAGHSGVVPRWLRRDAMFAVADLMMRLDEHWRTLLERGTDLVVTCGVVGTDPQEHSITRIPGYVGFSVDIRSRSQATLDDFHQLMQDECAAISAERQVNFIVDRRIESAPAVLDEKLVALLSEACADCAVPFEEIPSGAGHDAALFANAGIASGMLFVRNQHGSHNPQESMDIDDFMQGVKVLTHAITRLGHTIPS